MDEEIDCRTAQRLLSLRMDRSLGAAEDSPLQHHLAQCLPCRRVEHQLQVMQIALRRLAG